MTESFYIYETQYVPKCERCNVNERMDDYKLCEPCKKRLGRRMGLTETNVERLERLKDDVYIIHYHAGYEGLDTDLLWLIEQAERVQELEEFKEEYVDLNNDFTKLALENKRYREALEFYAEQDNYEWETSYRPQQEIDCMVIDDVGHTARKALEGDANG